LKTDQVDFLLLVQKEVSDRPSGDQLMLFIANEAYEHDILEEDGVVQWREDERSKAGDMLKARGLTETWITRLQEEEDDDESEEEDEEEDEDEDEDEED